MDKKIICKDCRREITFEVDKEIECKECERKIIFEADKEIICKDCGKEFVLTVAEQKWYKEKGFNDPVRCKECRQARKVKEMK